MRTERAERDSQVTNLFSQEKHSVGVEVQSVSNGKNTHWDSIAPFTPYPHSQATSLGTYGLWCKSTKKPLLSSQMAMNVQLYS